MTFLENGNIELDKKEQTILSTLIFSFYENQPKELSAYLDSDYKHSFRLVHCESKAKDLIWQISKRITDNRADFSDTWKEIKAEADQATVNILTGMIGIFDGEEAKNENNK